MTLLTADSKVPASIVVDAIDVVNPATGTLIRSVEAVNPLAIPALVERARSVQPDWQELGFEGRGRVLRRAQHWLIANSELVIETIVSETGKTYEDAQLSELTYGASAFSFWARMAPRYLASRRIRSRNPLARGARLATSYSPRGVVGVIGPWNYPLTNSFGDCIPALAAGNAVILKPSELTPLTSLLMARMLEECGAPRDVFQVAPGFAATAEVLIDHCDFIMFTGSTTTGKKVAERAARTLTPVALELGGKDPMIVLADADVDRAARAAAYYALQNAGQTCISVERIYVEEPVYDEFVANVVARVRALRQGIPAGPGSVEVGALTAPAQREIVSRHVDDALAKGATALVGGTGEGTSGHYFEPTVLVGVHHAMAAMSEETFGPTVPIMKVADAEEALRLANDSPYGLAGSIWTADVSGGERLCRRLDVGLACVNEGPIVAYATLDLPMGGWKQSGIGARHSAEGIRKYCRRQSTFARRFTPGRDLHMFPYSRGVTKSVGHLFRALYGSRSPAGKTRGDG